MSNKPELNELRGNIAALGSMLQRDIFEVIKHASINDHEISDLNSLLNNIIYNHRELLKFIDEKLS